jgi:hypothetical protein
MKMNSRNQLFKILFVQTVGAIFGYVWLLSIPLNLFFVVMAIFYDWSWGNLLSSFIAGGIAKWLSRGFQDSVERLKIEHFLCSKHEYTLKQAREFWTKAYNDGGNLQVLKIYNLTDEQLSTMRELLN